MVSVAITQLYHRGRTAIDSVQAHIFGHVPSNFIYENRQRGLDWVRKLYVFDSCFGPMAKVENI